MCCVHSCRDDYYQIVPLFLTEDGNKSQKSQGRSDQSSIGYIPATVPRWAHKPTPTPQGSNVPGK